MKTEGRKIHVYFMPGMATDKAIFENIQLPKDQFETHFLEWEIPKKNESLKEYAERYASYIKHKDAVLIGVSFGGIIVQEMAKFLNLKRLIIISSVKCSDELPAHMRFASKTGLFRIVPTSLARYVDYFEKVAVGDFLKTRAKLYRQFISVRNKRYLDWAIRNMVNWECEKPNEEVIHIHGDKDEVFAFKNIKKAIVVEGGTHIMIVNRFRWFNENLPEIILSGTLKKKQEQNKF